MYSYLTKKISIPDGTLLSSIAWNGQDEWIACGGYNGLLKVLKLEISNNINGSDGGMYKANNNLTENQSLGGHSCSIKFLRWNEKHQKLTTCDDSGLVYIWSFQNGQWLEENRTERQMNCVSFLEWNPEFERIAIGYEDGYFVMGNVDGEKEWMKNNEKVFSLMKWSPDSRRILLCTRDANCFIYTSEGELISKMDNISSTPDLVDIDWYCGDRDDDDDDQGRLIFLFNDGHIFLMKDEKDENLKVIDTEILEPRRIKWNGDGTVFGVAGKNSRYGERERKEDNICIIKFFNLSGEMLHRLSVPGSNISDFDWEGSGSKITIAADANIFFAQLRLKYEWGFFNDTLVYAFIQKSIGDHAIMFWNTKNDDKRILQLKNFKSLRTSEELCAILTKVEGRKDYIVSIYNEMGCKVDLEEAKIPVKYFGLAKSALVMASDDLVHVWNFDIQTQADDKHVNQFKNNKEKRDKIFHIDYQPRTGKDDDWYKYLNKKSENPISAICAKGSLVFIARKSGIVYRYILPHVIAEGKHLLKCCPMRMDLNCDCSRMAIIDGEFTLTFFDFSTTSDTNIDQTVSGEHLETFSRKDVCEVLWSLDCPELLLVIEKVRVSILRGGNVEETIPFLSRPYMFNQLEVFAVSLDNLLSRNPCVPDSYVLSKHEAQCLKDVRQMLQGCKLEEVWQVIESNPHPRLWRLIADRSLEMLNFSIAEKAFARHFTQIIF